MVELEDLLLKLAELSINKVGRAQKESRIRFMVIPRIRETRRVAQGKFTQMSSTKIENAVICRFHHDDLRNLFEAEIMPAKEYQDTHEFIQSSHPEHLKNLEKDGFFFFASVVHNHFWNVPPDPVTDITNIFLNDLFGKPIPWEITIWLIGFYLESDFQYKNITIKTPTEEDLMIERGLGDPAFWLRTRRTIPSAILETIFIPDEHFEQPYDYVAKLIISLKLFRPGID